MPQNTETIAKLIIVGAIIYFASMFVTADQFIHALRGLLQ